MDESTVNLPDYTFYYCNTDTPHHKLRTFALENASLTTLVRKHYAYNRIYVEYLYDDISVDDVFEIARKDREIPMPVAQFSSKIGHNEPFSSSGTTFEDGCKSYVIIWQIGESKYCTTRHSMEQLYNVIET